MLVSKDKTPKQEMRFSERKNLRPDHTMHDVALLVGISNDIRNRFHRRESVFPRQVAEVVRQSIGTYEFKKVPRVRILPLRQFTRVTTQSELAPVARRQFARVARG
jgi:hypothetical protein